MCSLTDAMLRRSLGLSEGADLSKAKVSTLSLCGRRSGRGKLRRIEPAIGVLAGLRSLNLSFNRIAAGIGHLSALASLRELDLFENQLTSVEGLEALVLLERLNLSGNRIERIAPLAKLPCLTTLRLERNRVASLSDVDALSGLRNLRSLSLRGNAGGAFEAPHARPYVLFRLCSLEVLDSRLQRHVCTIH